MAHKRTMSCAALVKRVRAARKRILSSHKARKNRKYREQYTRLWKQGRAQGCPVGMFDIFAYFKE